MAVCKKCGEEVDELLAVEVGRRTDELREENEIAEGAEKAMQGMMEYKGRQ